MHYNMIPPPKIIQSQSQVLQPIRIIATPPMTPYENDSRSIVDNFSDTSYENYRNNNVFNRIPREEYNTFGLQIPQKVGKGERGERGEKGQKVERRQSKYKDILVNGPPPPEPKKETTEIAVITVPIKEKSEVPVQPKPSATPPPKPPVLIQTTKPIKYTIDELASATAILGDFTPTHPLKLTDKQFGIIEERLIQKEVTTQEEPVKSEPVKKIYEPKPKLNPICVNVDFDSGSESGYSPSPKRTHSPVQVHVPIQGLAQPTTPYNSIPETRTEAIEFLTIEQMIHIGGKVYYIPSQRITMQAAAYIHAQDAEKKVSSNK